MLKYTRGTKCRLPMPRNFFLVHRIFTNSEWIANTKLCTENKLKYANKNIYGNNVDGKATERDRSKTVHKKRLGRE